MQSQLEATFANSRNQTAPFSSENKGNQDELDALRLAFEKKDAELEDANRELGRLRLDVEGETDDRAGLLGLVIENRKGLGVAAKILK